MQSPSTPVRPRAASAAGKFISRQPLHCVPPSPSVPRRTPSRGHNTQPQHTPAASNVGTVHRRDAEEHGALLGALAESVEKERASYASFSSCCATALTQARALAAEGHAVDGAAAEPTGRPHRLVVGVAAMLLTKMSTVLDRYGPLLRELLSEVLVGAYANVSAPAVLAELNAAADKDATPGQRGCGFLTRYALHSDAAEQSQEQLMRIAGTAAKLSATLSRTSVTVGSMCDRSSFVVVGHFFRAWRGYVHSKASGADRFTHYRTRHDQRQRKHLALARWKAYTVARRGHRIANTATHNSEQLTQRVSELSRQVSVREDEIAKQRAARERLNAKLQHLEEMHDRERLESTRLRTRVAEAENHGRSLSALAAVIMGRMEAAFNKLAVAPVANVIMAGEKNQADAAPERRRSSVGSTARRAPVKDVPAMVLRWINDRVGECDSSLKIAKLEELADGRAYVFLLAALSGQAAPPALETTTERLAHVISVARSLEVDGGVTATELMSGSADVHVAFLARLFALYVTVDKPGTERAKAVAAKQEVNNDAVETPTNETLVALMGRFEKLQVGVAYNTQWASLSRSVLNFAALEGLKAAKGADGMDAPQRRAFGDTTPKQLLAMLPPNTFRFAGGDATLDNPDVAAALQDVCNELRDVMQAGFAALRSAFDFYATSTMTDVMLPGIVDATGWNQFIADARLVPKHFPRASAEGILKSFSGFLDAASWPRAVLHLFFARTDANFIDADDIVAQFRAFVELAIVPALPISLAPQLGAVLNSGPVQEVLRLHRESLRRIFNDVATRETAIGSTQQHQRVRLDGFLQFAKDVKVGDDAEPARLFATVRMLVAAADGSHQAAEGSSKAASVAAPAAVGVGYIGFTGLVLCLALVRCGGHPLVPPAACLRQFITSILMHTFQHRAKLK